MQKIRICALMLDLHNTSPGQRFRLEQWDPLLKEKGVSIDYFSYADKNLRELISKKGHVFGKLTGLIRASIRRIIHIFKVSGYDVVYLYRAAGMIGPAWFEQVLRLRGVPIIYDFDDAIFIAHTNEANKAFSWAKFAGKTASICRLSTHVVVGNNWLGEYARKYNPNVTIIPSSVDTEHYVPRKTGSKRNRIIVGWTGSSTSQTHLEMFVPLLRRLLEERDVELHVHSDRSPNLEDVPFTWHEWSADSEVEVISSFDIGLMPMPDDEWSKGKCSMKALLYMSLGIPTVCTDIGMNKELIEHGKNGFLATDTQSWIEGLCRLIDDIDLRLSIGSEARKTVVENFSAKKCAELFSQVVNKVISD